VRLDKSTRILFQDDEGVRSARHLLQNGFDLVSAGGLNVFCPTGLQFHRFTFLSAIFPHMLILSNILVPPITTVKITRLGMVRFLAMDAFPIPE
jgi:hypothetical protein